MRFHEYSSLNGTHAILSASKYSWLNYDSERWQPRSALRKQPLLAHDSTSSLQSIFVCVFECPETTQRSTGTSTTLSDIA